MCTSNDFPKPTRSNLRIYERSGVRLAETIVSLYGILNPSKICALTIFTGISESELKMEPNVGRAVVQRSTYQYLWSPTSTARRGRHHVRISIRMSCPLRDWDSCFPRGRLITPAPKYIMEPALSFGFCEPSDFITDGK